MPELTQCAVPRASKYSNVQTTPVHDCLHHNEQGITGGPTKHARCSTPSQRDSLTTLVCSQRYSTQSECTSADFLSSCSIPPVLIYYYHGTETQVLVNSTSADILLRVLRVPWYTSACQLHKCGSDAHVLILPCGVGPSQAITPHWQSSELQVATTTNNQKYNKSTNNNYRQMCVYVRKRLASRDNHGVTSRACLLHVRVSMPRARLDKPRTRANVIAQALGDDE